MNKQLLKGTLDIIILLIISKKPTYGYEIAKMIQNISDNEIFLTDSTLYTILLRLEQFNYISSNWDSSESYPRRKYYKITSIGLSYLDTNIKEYYIIHSLIKLLNYKEASDE